MPRIVPQPAPSLEDKRFDHDGSASDGTVNKLDRLNEIPMAMAKAKVGQAIEAAIGGESGKQYGNAGLVSNLKSGAKVPDYLAEIYRDPKARQRFALALLDGTAVRRRLVLDWEDEDEGGR